MMVTTGYWLMVHGLILVQGSQFMVHGYLWLRIKGSWFRVMRKRSIR